MNLSFKRITLSGFSFQQRQPTKRSYTNKSSQVYMRYMFSYCNLKYTSFLSRQCSRMNELVAAVMNKYVTKLHLPSSLKNVRKPIILLLLKGWFARLPQIINNYSSFFFLVRDWGRTYKRLKINKFVHVSAIKHIVFHRESVCTKV